MINSSGAVPMTAVSKTLGDKISDNLSVQNEMMVALDKLNNIIMRINACGVPLNEKEKLSVPYTDSINGSVMNLYDTSRTNLHRMIELLTELDKLI